MYIYIYLFIYFRMKKVGRGMHSTRQMGTSLPILNNTILMPYMLVCKN